MQSQLRLVRATFERQLERWGRNWDGSDCSTVDLSFCLLQLKHELIRGQIGVRFAKLGDDLASEASGRSALRGGSLHCVLFVRVRLGLKEDLWSGAEF